MHFGVSVNIQNLGEAADPKGILKVWGTLGEVWVISSALERSRVPAAALFGSGCQGHDLIYLWVWVTERCSWWVGQGPVGVWLKWSCLKASLALERAEAACVHNDAAGIWSDTFGWYKEHQSGHPFLARSRCSDKSIFNVAGVEKSPEPVGCFSVDEMSICFFLLEGWGTEFSTTDIQASVMTDIEEKDTGWIYKI